MDIPNRASDAGPDREPYEHLHTETLGWWGVACTDCGAELTAAEIAADELRYKRRYSADLAADAKISDGEERE